MTLLAPANLLLAALIALPVLLVLYMLKLRRRPVRVSTVAFWTRAPEDSQANTPFQRPRASWLLLLHFLIITFLLAAIGRPALRDSFKSAQRTFIIIDTSASMSALDGNDERTRLERAKQVAKEQAARLLRGGGVGSMLGGLGGAGAGGSRQVAVITSAAQAQLASPFTSSRALIEAAIDRVQPTDQPGNLGAAFELARTTISSDTEESGQRDGAILLVTDGVADISAVGMPRTDITTDVNGELRPNAPAPLRTPAHRLRSPLALRVITVGAEVNDTDSPDTAVGGTALDKEAVTPINRGVTLLAAQRPNRSSPGTLQVFVQLASNVVLGAGSRDATAQGTIPGDDVPISVTLNGTVLARRVVPIAGPIEAPPGTVGGALGAPGLPGAPVAVDPPAVEAAPTPPGTAKAPTGLATATFELNNVGSGVLVVTIDLVDSLASDNFAAMVLDSAIKPAVLLVQPASSTSAAHVLLVDVLSELETRGVTKVNGEQYGALVNSGGLSAHDVVVFDGVVPGALPPLPSLTFGGVPPGGRCTWAQGQDDGSGGNVRFFWNRSHPLIRNITLDSLIIDDRSYFVCGGEPARGYEDVVSTREGAILMAFTRNSNRHIAASFALERTNWPLQPSFAVFLADALGYFTQQSDETAGRMSTTVQPVTVRKHADARTLEGPVSITLPNRATDAADDGQTATGMTEMLVGTLPRAGVYVVTPPPPAASTRPGAWAVRADRAVAVNVLNQTESLLTSVIQPGRSDGKGTAVTTSDATDGDVLAEFWPLAVAAALLLLCMEWFVYGRGVRA